MCSADHICKSIDLKMFHSVKFKPTIITYPSYLFLRVIDFAKIWEQYFASVDFRDSKKKGNKRAEGPVLQTVRKLQVLVKLYVLQKDTFARK